MNATLRRAIHIGLVLTAVLLTVEHGNADVCVYKPPTVSRVCGTIVDPSGNPIARVNVTVLRDGTTVKNGMTDETGEFNFQGLQSGKYEIDAMAPGFQHARYQMTLRSPVNSCKHALRIQMAVGGIHCGGDISETKNPLGQKR